MTRRRRTLLAAVLGVSLACPLASRAAEPSPQDQQTAQAVAGAVRDLAGLHHYTIDVTVQQGAVTLTGRVADEAQHQAVLQAAASAVGEARLRDRLVVAASATITPVQAPASQPPFAPPVNPPVTPPVAPPVGPPPGVLNPILPPLDFSAQPPRNLEPNQAANSPLPEPIPSFMAAPPPGPYDLTPPRMPPYAWPTYAPYNNFSRVAYPQAYPYQAWPFIGPVYPFPKIPPGWRSVKLEWEDGHWWFSRVATKHDWWRLRYW